jgi:hypothetical protein
MNTFTTLYTLTSQESIFNVFGILSSNTSKWVPTSQSLPTLSAFTLQKPKTTTVTPTYSALPVIVTSDTVYVKAFQHTKAISFYISAANMDGDYMTGVSNTSKYNVKGLDDTSIAATSISGVYVDYTTGLVFGQNYYSNGYKPFTTSVRIFATNKNGTASKVVNLIVGISPPQQGRLRSVYDNNWRSLSANFSKNYIPASRAFAPAGPLNNSSTAKYNIDQLETRHIVRACLSPILTAAFINSRPPFNCCGIWEMYDEQNTYTYSEILDETQPNTLYKSLQKDAYNLYGGSNENTPFIKRFQTGIPFFNTKQPMYWGMVATEINIKKSAYANTIQTGIADALIGADGFDRDKDIWSDDFIPYLYVNPLSSSTIPLSGWLRASSSPISLNIDGSFLPVFYSSKIHESTYGSLSAPKVTLTRYTSFTVLSNIIPPFDWGNVTTSGTYQYTGTNSAGYPIYGLSGSSNFPVKIVKESWDEPWELRVLGPYSSWWFGTELEGDLNVSLREGWTALSTVSTTVPLPSALPADDTLKIKEERGINLGAEISRGFLGSYVGDYSWSNSDNIIQKVYTDVNLNNEYDKFKYTNSKIIQSQTQVFSASINKFWSNFSSNIFGAFTIPDPPVLYKMYTRPRETYTYKPNEILEYRSNYLASLNSTGLSLTFVILFDNKVWISTTPPIKDAPGIYINAGLKLPLSSRQTKTFRSYSDLPDGENRLKSVFWNSTNLSYPRIVGDKNGIGHFGPLSAKCYWGIQDTLSSYYAVCNVASEYYDGEGNFYGFDLPTSEWYTAPNNISFRETSKYAKLSSVPQLLSVYDNSDYERFTPQFYYGTKMSDLTTHSLSGIITHGKALVFRGDISNTDFFDPENYINAATKYNTSYVSSDPMVAYGTDLRFGEEQVAALRVLGYM